ncbi:hypothetical protein HJC23_010182 [Cyclotella cryptica]|uniref:U1-type domain-containing protein n=1 Tax=Cyclotella cryptica TaxID=29204 RepID=A0ABD3PHG3_9STRA|eukprot:CCRYP_014706-RA/>CCRYP_014706-RA protein AED:0.37 eAED:0.37 QI:0/-1/0/1/-1/1/1/0/301
MSSSINKNVNVERRTWDKEAYQARARSRAAAAAAEEDQQSSHVPGAATKNAIDETEEIPEEFLPAESGRAGPMGSQRAFLKSRSSRVDLTSKLGSVEIIDPNAASNVGGSSGAAKGAAGVVTGNGVTKCTDGVGWHCRVCDCFLKDSLTYLDHINGRKHQRYLGYSMRVEKSTVDDVGGVLKGLAEKKNSNSDDVVETVDFEEVVKAKEEEALRRKAERARRREERKKRARGEVNMCNDDLEKEESDGNPAHENPADEAENAEERDDAGGEDDDEEEECGGIDPNLAAMMGFSGFGGSRKK